MLFRDVISLVSTIYVEDEIGQQIPQQTLREVFANKKSIRQSEFYQAANANLKPELMFEVRYFDFDEEQEIEYDGKRYSIIRTYSKNGEFIELICSKKVSNV